MTAIHNGKRILTPYGLDVKNYLDNNEPRFARRDRTITEHVVIHETAGRTAAGCKRTLLKKGYGVHFIIDRDGTTSNHGDILLDRLIHANQLNKTSVGIEIVNPYAPKLAGGIPIDTIPAEWWTWTPDKKDRRYVLPTDAQLKSLGLLVPWLCDVLGISFIFPTLGLNAKQRKIKNWMLRAKPAPGVVAHRDFASHADGRYPLEWLARQSEDKYLIDKYGLTD